MSNHFGDIFSTSFNDIDVRQKMKEHSVSEVEACLTKALGELLGGDVWVKIGKIDFGSPAGTVVLDAVAIDRDFTSTRTRGNNAQADGPHTDTP